MTNDPLISAEARLPLLGGKERLTVCQFAAHLTGALVVSVERPTRYGWRPVRGWVIPAPAVARLKQFLRETETLH